MVLRVAAASQRRDDIGADRGRLDLHGPRALRGQRRSGRDGATHRASGRIGLHAICCRTARPEPAERAQPIGIDHARPGIAVTVAAAVTAVPVLPKDCTAYTGGWM